MAYEAVKVELTNSTGFPRRYTVASAVAIAKGTLLTLTDNRTAAAATGDNLAFAGIANMDKSATDYSTSITAWTDGIFRMYASGAIKTGEAIAVASTGVNGANHVIKVINTGGSSPTASGAAVIGYCLADATLVALGDVQEFRIKI